MGGPEENDLKNDLLKMLKYPGHKIFRVFFWLQYADSKLNVMVLGRPRGT